MEKFSAIYSRENGKGMMFDVDNDDTDDYVKNTEYLSKKARQDTKSENWQKFHLKLVD